jgi:hypothetical protein
MPILVYDDERDALVTSIYALPPDAQLLEFGAGHSTTFFAGLLTGTQHLTSVEHNSAWVDTVRTALAEAGLTDRVTLHVVPLSDVPYAIRAEEDVRPDAAAYFNPPVEWDAIRWVFVDGIMRAACLDLLRARLVVGTQVFLHDYTVRDWYDVAVRSYVRIGVTHTLAELRTRADSDWLVR